MKFIYPPEHVLLAKEICSENGGLLTELFSDTEPDKHHFPLRNRIVAGLCDAVVVIETDMKGGSMITAKLADGYNRDVFALPGRTTDRKSRGCNYLIQHNKAYMLTCCDDLIQVLGWNQDLHVKPKSQRELFIELTADEKQVVHLLQEKENLHIDDINLGSGLSSSAAAAAVLNLELQGVIVSLPGKRYKLI
jgi:DNA processing protein